MVKVEAGEQPTNKAHILKVEAGEQPINDTRMLEVEASEQYINEACMMRVEAGEQPKNEAAMMKMEDGGGRLVEGFQHLRPSRQQEARAPVGELEKQSRASSHLIG